jgi:hypothetical protein
MVDDTASIVSVVRVVNFEPACEGSQLSLADARAEREGQEAVFEGRDAAKQQQPTPGVS